MKVLVTGGAGYIGSHITAMLLDSGAEVAVIDDLSMGRRELLDERAEFRELSLLDTEKISRVLKEEKIGAVIHMAAKALVGEDRQNPAEYYRTNVIGTLSLLDAIATSGVSQIILSSTCAVYGSGALERNGLIVEESARTPISVYGETKLAMENATRAYAERHGFAWTALRYFNAAGASLDGKRGEWHEPETHLIPRAIRAVPGLGQENFELTVFGEDYPTADGTPIRDYIHVEDLSRAHIAALERRATGSMNVGSGRGYSVKEIIEAVASAAGSRPRLKTGPRREGDPARLVADTSRATELLRWEPTHGLKTIIETALAWEKKLRVVRGA